MSNILPVLTLRSRATGVPLSINPLLVASIVEIQQSSQHGGSQVYLLGIPTSFEVVETRTEILQLMQQMIDQIK